MTDHEAGDVVGVFADKLQVEIDAADVPGETGHSYRTATDVDADDDTNTVTVEAGHTYFRFDGDLFMFDGVTYRPTSDHRDDEDFMDGDVDMAYPDKFYPDEGHPLNPAGGLTVEGFVDMLTSGRLEPAIDPSMDYED